ncbi:MAG: endolytic transglycosylase MltG, partial [Oscillospiraceae bacterium]|nr:endolytic transglycosylase MltG [Oscillospiraceae bacterium]
PYVRNIPRSMVAAYDTYATPGLPVGAICNPGSLAITSTLNPTEHDYYFFVTDKNGQFYWGKTAAEHERNIQIMNQVNAS